MFEFLSWWFQMIGLAWIRECWMMMMSGTSTGRKGLICERRETSLVGGHDIPRVQFRANMDLGSGDTSDFYTLGTDIQNSYDWDARLDSHEYPPPQPTLTKTHFSETTSVPEPPPSLPPSTPSVGQPTTSSSSSESLHGHASHENLTKSGAKRNNQSEGASSTLAVVEDGKEPNFTANESNPTVPAPAEPSKTSTLRLSDRTRSESEDDIEKMDDPEQEGTIIGHKTLYKTTAAAENSPNSEKIDKNGNRSDLDQSDTDNDCVVQCLYYTIQCCECVIF